MNNHSITSNNIKLLKHLDSLRALQEGVGRPISIVVSPTNKCNTNCSYCCFKGRDKSLEQDINYLKESLGQFYKLGVRGVEFTGGGDPTMYRDINELINYCRSTGFKIGMNTNGYLWKNIKHPEELTWVRLSLNFIDNISADKADFQLLVKEWQKHMKLSAGYVVTNKHINNLASVIKFSEDNKIPTRIVPDSIKERQETLSFLSQISLTPELKSSSYCFLEEANNLPTQRNDSFCANHFVKPFLYTDGYVYPCPSMELSVENNFCVNEKLRVCKGVDAYKYYSGTFETFNNPCKYCKYANQNLLIQQVIEKTDFNEFV